MTREAIKFFENLISETERVLADRPEMLREVETVLPYYRMAIEALEKQIPKKVVKVKLRESEWGVPWRCPLCEADIAKVEFMRDDGFEPKEKVSYCWHCGQAIDWSEE